MLIILRKTDHFCTSLPPDKIGRCYRLPFCIIVNCVAYSHACADLSFNAYAFQASSRLITRIANDGFCMTSFTVVVACGQHGLLSLTSLRVADCRGV